MSSLFITEISVYQSDCLTLLIHLIHILEYSDLFLEFQELISARKKTSNTSQSAFYVNKGITLNMNLNNKNLKDNVFKQIC